MKNSIDIHQLTGIFNEARQKNADKSFTYAELMNLLFSLGFNKGVSKSMTKLFDSEKVGQSKLFSFKKTPVHESMIKAVYDTIRNCNARSAKKSKKVVVEVFTKKEQNTIDLINSLKIVGGSEYRVLKNAGIDISRIKREDPDLYKELERRFTKWVIV
jgi:predicted choloylglycine hydrolase